MATSMPQTGSRVTGTADMPFSFTHPYLRYRDSIVFGLPDNSCCFVGLANLYSARCHALVIRYSGAIRAVQYSRISRAGHTAEIWLKYIHALALVFEHKIEYHLLPGAEFDLLGTRQSQ